MGNSRTRTDDSLAEGLRYEKAGLLDKALSLYRDVRRGTRDPSLVAESWTLEAHIHHAHGDWEAALAAAISGQELARELDRPDLMAEALNARATVHYSRGEFLEAQQLFEEMLELSEDPRVRGLALQNLGSLHGQLGELDLSEQRFAEAERHFEEAGYEWGRAHVHNNRAALALDRKDHAGAEAASRAAVQVARLSGDLDLLAIATMNLSEALAGLGRLDEAEEEASKALGQFEISKNAWRRVACFRILGDLNAHQGDMEVARRMWERGLKLARQIGASVDAGELSQRLERGLPDFEPRQG
ncbi:MAG: tetratricopeptide repeat protein [Gemmatimonadetes bacterium]|nr:tetratricopeptide repeat protein [Gemmatimonadota bacterium]